MRAKRYIQLESEEILTLEEGRKNSKQDQFRDRCHCLLLSNQQYDIDTLADIFQVSRYTIMNWFNSWRDKGLRGLMNEPGQGRKAILTLKDHSIIKAKVQASPQHLKRVREELKEELKKEFSTKTLTRFLKSLVRPDGDVGVRA
jgi:transposase